MHRIAIIGCGGSGKSQLARHLGALLAIEVIHLDALYYDQQWNPLPHEQFAELQRELVTGPNWIIDGNYASTLAIRLARVDAVFLDPPAWTCLWGMVQRRLRHWGGQHASLGVYDRITWDFLHYVLGYRRWRRPRVQQLLAEYAPHLDPVVLRSRRAIRDFLDLHWPPTSGQMTRQHSSRVPQGGPSTLRK